MPRSADDTRRALLDAAEQRFAAEGIHAATFADITDDAGQRNNSAIQYHFGDRIGLLEAVTDRRVEQMATHRDELLDRLADCPTIDQLIEVVIHPLSALLRDPGGAAYLRIQAELLAHPALAELPPMLAEPWNRPGMGRILPMLEERLPAHSRRHLGVRTTLVLTLIFHGLADRARRTDHDGDHDEFVRGLVRATVAVLETPMD